MPTVFVTAISRASREITGPANSVGIAVSTVAFALSRCRRTRRDPPSAASTYTSVRPSREISMTRCRKALPPPSPGTGIARRDGGNSAVALGRSHPQAATTAATTNAAGQSTRDARDGRAATRARVVGERRVAEEAVPASAAANSAALANRSAGNFSSAVRIASATSSGTLLRSAVTGSGALCITRAITACAFGPVNGGSPASISCSTQPSA